MIFGESDIDILDAEAGRKLERDEAPTDDIKVKVNGVDMLHPNTGRVRSDGAEGVACWFIDTDYNEKASSSARPISSAPAIPTNLSRSCSILISTWEHGNL